MKHPDAEGDWQGTPLRAGASHHLQTVPEQIAECILAAIEGGEFVPGERIREETLAEQFAVSRGPVREALRILERDQVVRILPNRGAHVTQFSIKEVCDLFDIRRDLVAAMIRRLGRGRDEVATWIDTEVRELETVVLASRPGDPHLTIIDRLGRMLADSSGNERLAEILGSLARQTRRYAKLGLATAARRQESARNWRTLLDDLKAGDVNRAANAVEHLSDASRHEAVRQYRRQRLAPETTRPDTNRPDTKRRTSPSEQRTCFNECKENRRPCLVMGRSPVSRPSCGRVPRP